MIKNIIILLGAPGSGKGTQGYILSKKLKIPHISTGDILRKMALENSKDSIVLAEYMKEGKLVPSELVNVIVKRFILSDLCEKGCILDGYPRNLEQAQYFIENINANVGVIFFDVTDEIATKRILGRVSCISCNKVYNMHFDQPKIKGFCDECGGKKFSERSDDNANTIRSRLEEYRKNTLPIVEYYKEKGKFFAINGRESKEKIIEEVDAIIKKI